MQFPCGPVYIVHINMHPGESGHKETALSRPVKWPCSIGSHFLFYVQIKTISVFKRPNAFFFLNQWEAAMQFPCLVCWKFKEEEINTDPWHVPGKPIKMSDALVWQLDFVWHSSAPISNMTVCQWVHISTHTKDIGWVGGPSMWPRPPLNVVRVIGSQCVCGMHLIQFTLVLRAVPLWPCLSRMQVNTRCECFLKI